MMKFWFSGIVGGPQINDNKKVSWPKDTNSNNPKDPSGEKFSINNNQTASAKVKGSQINAIRSAEHINSSRNLVVSRINNHVQGIAKTTNQIGNVISSGAFKGVKQEDVSSKLLNKAALLHKKSESFANINDIKTPKLSLAKDLAGKVTGYVESTQRNFDLASSEMTKSKHMNMSQLMSLSTKLNEANSGMYEILTVARQLVDGVNKITNTQI